MAYCQELYKLIPWQDVIYTLPYPIRGEKKNRIMEKRKNGIAPVRKYMYVQSGIFQNAKLCTYFCVQSAILKFGFLR
jgi:hypothetical protein